MPEPSQPTFRDKLLSKAREIVQNTKGLRPVQTNSYGQIPEYEARLLQAAAKAGNAAAPYLKGNVALVNKATETGQRMAQPSSPIMFPRPEYQGYKAVQEYPAIQAYVQKVMDEAK